MKNEKAGKPESCPSCGSREVIIETASNAGGRKYRAKCRNCCLQTKWCGGEADARKLWEAFGARAAGAKANPRYEGLLYTPAADANFKSGIARMEAADLKGMLGRLRVLEGIEGGHKGRIKAAEKELKRREK